MHQSLRRVSLFLAALVLFAPAAAPAQDKAEKLPFDPRIKTGTLPNGLKWMYRQHDVPPGKMALWIHVETGSLNEADEQRGLAHFLEHMAFNGTENFEPDALVPYFESIGMQFGPDLNAFTGFDQTSYMLFLPDTKEETVDKGLLVLSDYVFRQSLLPEELDKERGVILSEKRAGLGPEQRLQEAFFARLFENMRIGQRIPIGAEKVIAEAPREEFERYYRTWYRPERMTLLLVGDAPPDKYLKSVEKWFGEYKAPLEAKAPLGAGFKPFEKERGIVLSDPEYTECEVGLYNLATGRSPTTTVAQYRVEQIEQLGSWIMERRLAERIREGKASYREASVGTDNFLNEMLISSASATGEPQDWEKMLEELGQEMARALQYGFLEQELELARTDTLASAEDAVRKDATRNARMILFEMNRAVSDEEPVMSAEQRLELKKQLIPGIKLDEVNATFQANFKPGAFSFIVQLPQNETIKLPSEDEVLAGGRAAFARKMDPPKWEERPTTLLEKEPTPGKFGESALDPELQVTSGWLDNGVRVHHRFMDYKKDLILVSITLAGGEIEETAENAGISYVSALILNQPATSRLKSSDVEDILTGKNINVGGSANGDMFQLVVSGSPTDLESGLQLAHALLTDGKLEESAFKKWKEQVLQQYEQGRKNPIYRAQEELRSLMSGGDPRRTVLNPDKVAKLSVEKGQAWFQRLAKEAPIEVAVVGEMQLDQVTPLIEKYVGSLGKRPRTAEHLDKLRKLPRKPGPLEGVVKVDTITPQAMVFAGFVGANQRDVADVRRLNLAALTLDSRLIKRVREELGIVYSIQAMSQPSRSYEDSGFFLSGAPCAPERAEDVVKEVLTAFREFAEKGPTAEELENAHKQIANELDTELREPSFWWEQLRTIDLHQRKLDDLKQIPESYAAITADDVRTAFAKYFTPERQMQVITLPSEVREGAAMDAPEAPREGPPEKDKKVETKPPVPPPAKRP